VLDGESVLTSTLPPNRDVTFAVSIAIAPQGDFVAAGEEAPVPGATHPTVDVDVVVRSEVWPRQPAPQKLSISREGRSSTSAAFAFTTPDSGGLVTIEVVVLYRGRALHTSTYVAPVGTAALPDEGPTPTTFTSSGPHEPPDEPRPADATLDGRDDLLRDLSGDATVPIEGLRELLDTIEERASRVLAVPGPPASFDDPRALEMLIALARTGAQLNMRLARFELSDKYRINILVRYDSPVLPLELVYAGPVPRRNAMLCHHDEPPPPGQVCTKASSRRVCPYAFWGLHHSISRTVESRLNRRPVPRPAGPISLLYAATARADAGASDPRPTTALLEAAESLFPTVTRVTSWTAWRNAVRTGEPNLLVLLCEAVVEHGETNLYIGRNSRLAQPDITPAEVLASDGPSPLVLLITGGTASALSVFGLQASFMAAGANAVVGNLSKITGTDGAVAITHLLRSFHDLAGTGASVGDAVAAARRSLVAENRPVGLLLVSHGEDTTVLV
jgi:hypothetical protein